MQYFSKIALSFLLISFSLGVDASAELASERDLNLKLFEQACFEKGVPPKVAFAIAQHESGMNPFAVNVAGKSYLPRTKKQALAIIQEAEAQNQSYEVGLMQINSQWFSRLGVSPTSLLEADKNIDTGVKILAGEFGKHGKNWTAVGYYHSPTPTRGLAYSWKIYQLYHGKSSTAQVQPRNPQPKIESKKVNGHAEQKTDNQNLLDGRGIWRNPGTSKESRFVTFKICEPGIIRLSRSKPGKSSNQTGTSED